MHTFAAAWLSLHRWGAENITYVSARFSLRLFAAHVYKNHSTDATITRVSQNYTEVFVYEQRKVSYFVGIGDGRAP